MVEDKILVYGFGEGCVYCDRAVTLLRVRGFDFEFFDIRKDEEKKEELRLKRGLESLSGHTVPQIFINDEYIGGYVQLAKRYG